MIRLKVKKLNPNALLPKYAKPGDAALDLFAIVDRGLLLLPPHTHALVKTGIAIEVPEGYEAQIRPRSGLALKNCVTVLNSPGTVDSGYRGEIGVLLMNNGDEVFSVHDGDRIAQLLVKVVEQVDIQEVEELSDSARSTGGFGSTGV